MPQQLALLRQIIETEAIGGAWSQSPACGDDMAKILALSVSKRVTVEICAVWLYLLRRVNSVI